VSPIHDECHAPATILLHGTKSVRVQAAAYNEAVPVPVTEGVSISY
jgi:hypothetical protein